MGLILHDFGDEGKRERPSLQQEAGAWLVIGFMTILFTIALVGSMSEWGHWDTPQQQTAQEGRR